MKNEELRKILEKHKLWLKGSKEGKKANLQWADLREADLQKANLRGAELLWADLRGANLQRADLQRADLRGVNLREADLRETDLRGVNLQKANLQRADLRGADLRGANLQGADLQGVNLQGANLDFSVWPLWCGSLDVKVDARIARQLAYHLCRLDCDDEEYLKVRDAIKDLANKFHRADECGRIE